MTTLALARADDRLPMLRTTIDPTVLLHHWRNADDDAHSISDVVLERRDDKIWVRVLVVGPDGPVDWGETQATLYTDISCTGGGRSTVEPVTDGRPTAHYADNTANDAGPAFTATFDRDFANVHLQGRLNLGLLVIETFYEFTDGSGRNSYYHRECFGR